MNLFEQIMKDLLGDPLGNDAPFGGSTKNGKTDNDEQTSGNKKDSDRPSNPTVGLPPIVKDLGEMAEAFFGGLFSGLDEDAPTDEKDSSKKTTTANDTEAKTAPTAAAKREKPADCTCPPDPNVTLCRTCLEKATATWDTEQTDSSVADEAPVDAAESVVTAPKAKLHTETDSDAVVVVYVRVDGAHYGPPLRVFGFSDFENARSYATAFSDAKVTYYGQELGAYAARKNVVETDGEFTPLEAARLFIESDETIALGTQDWSGHAGL